MTTRNVTIDLLRRILVSSAIFTSACGGGTPSGDSSGTAVPLPRALAYESLDGRQGQYSSSVGQYSPYPDHLSVDGYYSAYLFKVVQTLGDLGNERKLLEDRGAITTNPTGQILPLVDSQYFDSRTLILVNTEYLTIISRVYLRNLIETSDRVEVSYEICADVPSLIGYPGYGPERSEQTQWFSIPKTKKLIVVLPLTLTKGAAYGQSPISPFTGAAC